MKRIGLFFLICILAAAACACDTASQPVETVAPRQTRSAAPTEATPLPTPDMNLDETASLAGMVYRYGSTWTELTDPLYSGTERSFEVPAGSGVPIVISFTADLVEALRTWPDASAPEREQLLVQCIGQTVQDLGDVDIERSSAPPDGARAMWSFKGTQESETLPIVQGYGIAGDSHVYAVRAEVPNDATLEAVEPAWRSLVNSLVLPPITAPTPEPTPEPAAETEAPAAPAAPVVEATPAPVQAEIIEAVPAEDFRQNEVALANYLLSRSFRSDAGDILTFSRNTENSQTLDSYLNGQLDYSGWFYGSQYNGYSVYDGAAHLIFNVDEAGNVDYLFAVFYPQ